MERQSLMSGQDDFFRSHCIEVMHFLEQARSLDWYPSPTPLMISKEKFYHAKYILAQLNELAEDDIYLRLVIPNGELIKLLDENSIYIVLHRLNIYPQKVIEIDDVCVFRGKRELSFGRKLAIFARFAVLGNLLVLKRIGVE